MAPPREPKLPNRAMSDPNDTASTDLLARIADATELLESLIDDRGLLASVPREDRDRFLMAAGRVSRPDKKERRRLAKAQRKHQELEQRADDEAVLDSTGIRKLRESPIFQTPRLTGEAPKLLGDGSATTDATVNDEAAHDTRTTSEPVGRLHKARKCYVCQTQYRDVHHFYDHMCLECGDLNYEKRTQVADLNGRVALVTGARVKIGYQAAILLLRSGCRVIVTTRFPRDAARRYAAEEDFAEWRHRLHIHGIDLRHTPSVEALCTHLLSTLDRLDFIINNACQTVRRPPGFYSHLMDGERTPADELPASERALLGTDTASADLAVLGGGAAASDVKAADLTQFEFLPEDRERGEHLFPSGALDADEQQIDLREVNSWRLKLADVSAVELLEVQLVNAVAPFILNARLKPLMTKTPERDKHIVNVSAMEGQFYRIFKTDRHPHTNMAKAALNMLTRTSAADYVEDGIHMNSVDTGWVTDEDPVAHADKKREVHRFHPPLDIVDGAARIVDPIFTGARTGEHVWGQFLKDYRIVDW